MLDGEQEAHLIALACGSSPVGRYRWMLGLLADKLIELGHVGKVFQKTIRRTLKKTTWSRGSESDHDNRQRSDHDNRCSISPWEYRSVPLLRMGNGTIFPILSRDNANR